MLGSMKRAFSSVVLFVALWNSAFGQSGSLVTATGKPLFTFHNGFWINLHHFLYVLGRARNGTADSQRSAVMHAPEDLEDFNALNKRDRTTWQEAIEFYRNELSKRDVIFDRELIGITRALASVLDSSSLAGTALPSQVRETLERAAPVYRRVWWDRHSRSNKTRITALSALLVQYGPQVSNMLTHIYEQQWPANGLDVEVSAYANWGGAYSIGGGPIIMSSTDDAGTGSEGLEIVFHEAMHQWDDAMIPLLDSTAQRLNVKIPRDLFHSLIFYTAGYVVSRIVPGHRPYAEPLWARGVLPGRTQLDADWLPYLQGNGSLSSAIEKLVGAFKSPPNSLPPSPETQNSQTHRWSLIAS